MWVNTEQAPPSPSSTHCTGVGEQLSSHPPTGESTHNHCVPRTPSLVCLIYRIMAAFVFTCCPFFNISQQERHPYLSCFKKYIPVPASPFLSNASHCWRSSPKSQRRASIVSLIHKSMLVVPSLPRPRSQNLSTKHGGKPSGGDDQCQEGEVGGRFGRLVVYKPDTVEKIRKNTFF